MSPKKFVTGCVRSPSHSGAGSSNLGPALLTIPVVYDEMEWRDQEGMNVGRVSSRNLAVNMFHACRRAALRRNRMLQVILGGL